MAETPASFTRVKQSAWRVGQNAQSSEEPAVARGPSRIEGAVKRGADIVVAALAIFALLPAFVLVALAIKLTSPGAVLFRQVREGRQGRLIRVFKFRTMCVDQEDASGIHQTIHADARTTPVGRFLRAASIDELPQLLNVILGDMSLVGPRPHVPGMLAAGRPYDELVPYYHDRRLMRPGITGWAQANGLRGPTVNAAKAIARIDHDLYYIENFSLWLDFRIIVMTLRHEFLGGSGV